MTDSMPGLVAGLHVGDSHVSAWVADADGRMLAAQTQPLPVRRPAPGRVEFDPTDWWAGARAALGTVVGRAPGGYLGLTVSAAREGFVLTDGRVELGQGVLRGDRRGAGWLAEIAAHRQLYAMTRHWPAPELTLPKLLAVRAESPRLWAQARQLLFVHDWLIWRLSGVAATEVSYACAGQLAHVSQRTWAGSLLDDLGVPRRLLAPLVEAGDVVGGLRDPNLGLPLGLPVIAGCGDVQLAAAGAGAAHPGVVAVAAGGDTALLAAAESAPLDPQQRPWVSTHLPRGTWAVETNCGSPARMLAWLAAVVGVPVAEVFAMGQRARPGAGGLTAAVGMPRWSEQSRAAPASGSLLGVTPDTGAADLAAAFVEGYAYSVRANLIDLEDVLGYPARRLVLTGPDAGAGLARMLAEVTGRDVAVAETPTPGVLAGVALVAAAVGVSSAAALPNQEVVVAGDPGPYEEPYARYLAAHDAVRSWAGEHAPV